MQNLWRFIQNQSHWTTLIVLYFCQLSQSLKCYECTTIEGSESYEPACALTSGSGASSKDGFAGCLKVDIVSEINEDMVIRAGFLNSQVLGRPLSCYHAEPGFVVHGNIEKIKFATLKSCLACDDQDGCNGVQRLHVTCPFLFLPIIFFIFI